MVNLLKLHMQISKISRMLCDATSDMRRIEYAAVLLAVFLLQGCLGLKPNEITQSKNAIEINEILGKLPLPEGSKLRHEHSLVIGAGDDWLGQARIEMQISSSEAYAFFIKHLPAAGWISKFSVFGKSSFMLFVRSNRNLSIDIERGQGSGTVIATITSAVDATPQVPKRN